MKSDRRLPVAIIGGGFSGTMVAAQLARKRVDCVLVEGGGRAGRGIAYSTAEPAHVLNVCAEMMSAWPDDADHFARAFGDEGGDGEDYAQRRQFGRYLGSILDSAIASGHVRLIEAMAVGARPENGGWSIELGSGEPVAASALVLALGNEAPEPLPFANGNGRVIGNPWSSEAAAAIAELAGSGGDALIVGTGLTMVDTVLSLDAAGHRGRITAVSRRGLIPRGHVELEPAPVGEADIPLGSVRELSRWLRRRSCEVGWRSAVDSLRPHSHAIWQSLSLSEQKRFLRHARPWWDVHRHRIAPEVAARLDLMIREGRLKVIAGRIGEVRSADGHLDVALARRNGGGERRVTADYLFNCTGPLGTVSRTRNPMLRHMLEQELVCPDALGIGIDVDASSRPIGSTLLWAVGPLTKGRFWEIIAVPDIRVQAAQVADDIARELGR